MNTGTISRGERLHIGFFGLRNAGKSSLVNAVSAQQMSIVSDTAGTTTDPVKKSMELLPLGAVVLVDTPGLDDEGALGALRVQKAYEQLELVDIAVAVLECGRDLRREERDLLQRLKKSGKSCIIVWNKSDLGRECIAEEWTKEFKSLALSALTLHNIELFKESLAELIKEKNQNRHIIADLLAPHSGVVLVIPIDESAPKGRIILPQQLVLRELLEHSCSIMVCRETELKESLERLQYKVDAVITDSQVFSAVADIVPQNIQLSSFSLLFARYKGELEHFLQGLESLEKLKDGDKVLIAEACTHRRQCKDIGTVKMPAWIEAYSKAKPCYMFCSGNDFPADLQDVRLVVHCGACMITEQAMKVRLDRLREAGVPVVNYGMAIAKMQGILDRALTIFNRI